MCVYQNLFVIMDNLERLLTFFFFSFFIFQIRSTLKANSDRMIKMSIYLFV